jgi:oligoribonuclease
MAQDPSNLIWIDMEMSGLDPETDRVLEIAVVITDSQLNLVDEWNKSTHAKSGLIERVKASTMNEAEAETAMLAFLAQHVPAKTSPLCGNSVHQDRRFLVKYLPRLEAFLLYRNLDVSTLKELARRWKPEVMAGLTKHGKHEALADIHESIAELRYYREHILKI